MMLRAGCDEARAGAKKLYGAFDRPSIPRT
jgi:hypothetical protein